MDSPNPQLCDWLALWYFPMTLASEDLLYNIIKLPKARNHLKAKNLLMDSPNPQLCDWLAPWYFLMPSASEDLLYNIISKLMMALG